MVFDFRHSGFRVLLPWCFLSFFFCVLRFPISCFLHRFMFSSFAPHLVIEVFSSGDILALLHPFSRGLDFIRELAAPVEVGSSPSISHRSGCFPPAPLSGLRKAGFHPLSGPDNLVTNLSCILLFWSRFL